MQANVIMIVLLILILFSCSALSEKELSKCDDIQLLFQLSVI